MPKSTPPPAPPADPVPGWRGFHAPRYTQTPDEVFDVWLAVLSFAELKVLLYIIRHTLGWKKDWDAISLDQLCHGIVRTDGSRLDAGTGLSVPGALAAIKRLVAYRLIIARRQTRPDGGDGPTVYGLYMADSPPPARPPRLNRFKTPGLTRFSPPSQLGADPPLNVVEPQETVTINNEAREGAPTLAGGLTVAEYNQRWREMHGG